MDFIDFLPQTIIQTTLVNNLFNEHKNYEILHGDVYSIAISSYLTQNSSIPVDLVIKKFVTKLSLNRHISKGG